MELNQVYNQDCLEGLDRMQSNSVDLVIADPPFCVGTTSNGLKGNWSDNNLIRPFFDLCCSKLSRVCKPDTELYINTDWRTYPLLYPIIYKYFYVRNLIVWDYEWIKAGVYYRFSHEFIIYATMGEAKRRFSASERDVWRIKPVNFTLKNKLHQSQKPTELIKKMIENSSTPGDVVCDPFMGSGTTAVVAESMGRNFIGFEIDENHFATCQRRIAEKRQQKKLF